MDIPILLACFCLVLAVVGIYATVSYLGLHDFSSCAPPQAEPRDTFHYSRANASVRRSYTVLETIAAAELAGQNHRGRATIEVRTWGDVDHFHRQMSSRLEAIRHASQRRSSARLHPTTIQIKWDSDIAP